MFTVTEGDKQGLKREFTIKETSAAIEGLVLEKIKEMNEKANISGFRPGKAPLVIAQQRFGATARSEAMQQFVDDAVKLVLSERNMRPAMQPKIQMISAEQGKDIEFKLSLEILPDVAIKDFTSIALDRFTADVEDKDVEEAVMRIAKSLLKATPVTDGRAASKGDTVIINFDGTVDGIAKPGMKGENHPLELGSGSFIDTFEDQLVGSNVGDKKNVKVTFPDQYHAQDLAGKDAVFAVEVKEVREPRKIELNDAAAKEMGFPSLDKLRERVKGDLAKHYASVTRSIVKKQLMDKLAEMYRFEVPESMMAREFGTIWNQIQVMKERQELPPEDAAKSDDELKKEYSDIAHRRIRLGLVLAEIARANKIDVHEKELRNALVAEVQRYPGREKEVFDYYTQNEGAIEQLRAPILEEKVVDYILKQIKVTEKKASSEELLKMPEEMA
ncbi:MAG: trigger factor [Bdellovibrionales bacterium]